MPEFDITSLLPMMPNEGPPLPRFLGIYWPWHRPETPKFSIGDWIVYHSIIYRVSNNQERDEQGRLLYQLVDVNTNIGYWFLVSEVDATATPYQAPVA